MRSGDLRKKSKKIQCVVRQDKKIKRVERNKNNILKCVVVG